MEVPIPCAFGEDADCEGRTLPFTGVNWFRWSSGIEYTYIFLINKKWGEYDLCGMDGTECQKTFTISDELLSDGPIRDKKIPLRGRGHISGVKYRNGRTYLDVVITDSYHEHILVECNDHYAPICGGDMIFPPTWDEERANRVLLRSMLKSVQKTVQKPTSEPAQIKEVSKPQEPRQLSFADYMSEAEIRRM